MLVVTIACVREVRLRRTLQPLLARLLADFRGNRILKTFRGLRRPILFWRRLRFFLIGPPLELESVPAALTDVAHARY